MFAECVVLLVGCVWWELFGEVEVFECVMFVGEEEKIVGGLKKSFLCKEFPGVLATAGKHDVRTRALLGRNSEQGTTSRVRCSGSHGVKQTGMPKWLLLVG